MNMEISYFNPISSHVEIELNNRLSVNGTRNANAVWQAHLDMFFNKYFRFSGNYLYDEYVFDPDIQIGKENGIAFSYRLAYTPIFSDSKLLTIFTKKVHVGTPTFRHEMGTNNFVQGGRPLGWIQGSDGEENTLGINYFNRKNMIMKVAKRSIKSGSENIIFREFDPYSDYLKGPFPSGNVIKKDIFDLCFQYLWLKNTLIETSFHLHQEGEKFKILDIGIIFNHYKELSF